MAHSVEFRVPTRPLGRNDVEFDVKLDGSTLGTLKISKGTVEWRPSHFDSSYGFHMNWSKFDEMMRENGRQRR